MLWWPYIVDEVTAVVPYADDYTAMGIVASLVTTDWINMLAIGMVPNEVKPDYVVLMMDHTNERYISVFNMINQLIGSNYDTNIEL